MSNDKAIFYGFNMPFFGGPQKILSRQVDDKLIKNDILQLLLTVPGERVMRPDFGVHLRSFLFEQNTDSDLSILENEIAQAITEYEKRVTVENVTVVSDTNKHGINVVVIVRMVKDPKKVLTIEQFFGIQ